MRTGHPHLQCTVLYCTVLQDEVGVYRFVTEDPNKATFRNLTLKPPCMLW